MTTPLMPCCCLNDPGLLPWGFNNGFEGVNDGFAVEVVVASLTQASLAVRQPLLARGTNLSNVVAVKRQFTNYADF